MGTAITAAITEAAIAEAMQIPTEMGTVTIIQAAAAEAGAATMAGIMEGTTGKKGKGDALCAANRRLSRQ